MPRLEPNSGGTDSRGVIVPRGTLMHVGGLPFRTRRDTEVDGTEENLAMGLDAVKGFKEARAFAHLLESASGPHMLSQMVLSEKWSDAARAAAAAARRAKGKGTNWRTAARRAYRTAAYRNEYHDRSMARMARDSAREDMERIKPGESMGLTRAGHYKNYSTGHGSDMGGLNFAKRVSTTDKATPGRLAHARGQLAVGRDYERRANAWKAAIERPRGSKRLRRPARA